uniref:Uncharacterized protein n=1 Tax=mine drainage metagenome TaxID=410659 RepID=E6QBF8_9ZZZZ
MFFLTTRFRGNPDIAHSCLLAAIHHMDEILKRHALIGSDGDLGFTGITISSEHFLQTVEVIVMTLHIHRSILIDIDGIVRARKLLRLTGGWKLQIQALIGDHLQRDHDKKHQQEEHDVDHGNDLHPALLLLEVTALHQLALATDNISLRCLSLLSGVIMG